MKRLFLFLFFFVGITTSAQTVWTVETVPNTRMQGNNIHVSDPDGFLSDSAEMNINAALCSIREQADVFLVTLATIGEAEPKHFATKLFNRWGIGDAETNNGVLLLFVEDQHAMEFETGYGAETILTDAKCERIFSKTMVPFFKKGDYEAGLMAGVGEIVVAYGDTVPDGLKATHSEEEKKYKDPRGIADELGTTWYTIFFGLFILLTPLLGFFYWIVKLGVKDKSAAKLYNGIDEGDAIYIDAMDAEWSGSPWGSMGCLGGMLIGLSVFLWGIVAFVVVEEGFPNVHGDAKDHWWIAITLFLYLTFICFCHNRRLMRISKRLAIKSLNPKKIYEIALSHTSNQIAMWMAPWLGIIYFLKLKHRIKKASDCVCPSCGGLMKSDSDFALSQIHQTEAKLGALRFHPYRCEFGHKYVLKEKGGNYANFTTCLKCGAFLCQKTDTQIVRQADYANKGEKIETYVCRHCGETTMKNITIPKKVKSYSGGSGGSYSSGSSSRSHSSHHSSHGSFGGGRSGGGGYSGRW